VIEPVAAESLAAVSAACVVAGLGFARSRHRSFARLRRLPSRLPPQLMWAGAPVALVLLLPAPRAVTVPLALVLGLRARRLVASRSAARRLRALDAEVPQLLDMLAASSAAGLSAAGGLRRSVAALRGPLGVELRAALDAVDLGARWRSELSDLTDRLALPDLRRAVAVLTRSETLGTSLTDATRELAADVRGARRDAVAERARAAPVKMLFPLVFLVLPAFLLLTVVPVLLTTVRSIR
jgi:tight adherence protein C